MWGKKSIVASPRIRKRSLTVEVNRSLTAPVTADKAAPALFFEALEPRILLSADGILPMPLDIGLLDTVSEVDPSSADVGNIPEDVKSATPEPESAHVDPDAEATTNREIQTSDNAPISSAEGNIEEGSETDAGAETSIESTDSIPELSTGEEIELVDHESSTEGEQILSGSLSTDLETTSEILENADHSGELTSIDGEDSVVVEDAETEVDQEVSAATEIEITESDDTEASVTSDVSNANEGVAPDLQIVFVDQSIDDYEQLLQSIAIDGIELVYGDEGNEPAHSDEEFAFQKEEATSDHLPSEDVTSSATAGLTDASSHSTFGINHNPTNIDTTSEGSANPKVVVYFIEPGENGINLMADRLSEHADVDAVHVLSHGAAGMINLGNARLHSGNLDRYSDALDQWGSAMAVEGDFYFYGCDVAGNQEGIQFVEDVAQYVGVNIAASNDATGSALSGGDFDFEVIVGEVDTTSLFATETTIGFSGLLPAEQLRFDMVSGENDVMISSDGTSITISDGSTSSSTLIADITDILITGVDNEDDTLTVDFATSFLIPIAFEGGIGGNDSLIIDNGAFDTVTYTATASDSGDITLETAVGDSTSISYSGLEPITDNSTAADRVFVGTAGANDIQLTNAATAGQSIIQDVVGGTFESITFENPTNSLTIQGGGGEDNIEVTATQDPGLVPTAGITIQGGADNDTLTLDGSAAFLDNLSFDGGAAGTDTLRINGGSFDNVTYTKTGVGAGDISLETAADSESVSFSNIEVVEDQSTSVNRTFVGSSAADTITLSDADTAATGQTQIASDVDVVFNNPTGELIINGAGGGDSISILPNLDSALAPSAGISVEGGTGDDTLFLDASSALPEDLSFDGGDDSDTLQISNGSYDSVTYTKTAAGAGNVSLSGATVTDNVSFSTLETLNDASSADQRTFIGSGLADVITLSDPDGATTGSSQISSEVDIVFTNPTTGLSIESGDGDDEIIATGVQDADLAPSSGVTIDGGIGADTVRLTGDDSFITTIFNSETIEVDGSDESDIDNAELDGGLTAFATFMSRLSSFGEFDVELPLTTDITVGGVSGMQEIISQLRADLAADPNFGPGGTDPSVANFEAFLQSWAPVIATPLGNITVVTSGITPTIVEVQNGNTIISRSLSVTATRSVDLTITNTDELVEANIALDSGTSNYTVDILTELSFSIGSDVTNDSFVTQISQLEVAASGSDIDLQGGLVVGVLGGTIDDTSDSYSIDADISVTFDDPNSDGAAVSLAELQAANSSNLDADNLVDISGSGEFELSFDFDTVDSFASSLGGTINVGGSSYDLFDDYGFGAPVELGADDLYGISLLSAGDLVRPIVDFAQWLDTLVQSGLYDGTLLLADDVRISDLLDYESLIANNLLGTGTAPDVLVNDDSDPLFQTVQEANAIIAAAFPVSPPLVFTYDAAEGTLDAAIVLDTSTTTMADFEYNLLLDSLSELNSDAQVTIDTSYGLTAEFKFDLTPIDQPAVKPMAADASAQTGQLPEDVSFDISINGGTAEEIVITSASTAGNGSIADLIADINAAFAASAVSGNVTASIDTNSGLENPRLMLSPATPGESIVISSLSRVDGGLLGLAQGVFDIDRNAFINTLPDIDVSAAGADFAFQLELDGVRSAVLSVAAASTSGLTSAADLVPLFDAALTGLDVSASVEDGRLIFIADNGASVNTLRLLADSDNPMVAVLGFDNAQVSSVKELAPAYFETANTNLSATIRTNWSDTTDVTGQFGFVEFSFTEAAAQSTLTLNTQLMDLDGEVDITQLAGDVGVIVNGPISSGSLSSTDIASDDYVTNAALRDVVSAASGPVQFAISLDGFVTGKADTPEHELLISATQASIFGDSTLGLENEVQEIVSAPLSVLSDGQLSGVATFDLVVDGADTFSVSVNTTGNTSSIDLLDDVNSAINAGLSSAGLDYAISARLLQDVIVISDAGGSVIEVSATNAVAQSELGLSDAGAATRAVFTDILVNPSLSFEGRPLTEVSFDIQIDNAAAVTVSVSQAATASNVSTVPTDVLNDLIADVNAALVAAGLGSQVEARLIASRLALVNTGAANSQLTVTANRLNTEVDGQSIDVFRSVNADYIADALVDFGTALEQTNYEDDGTVPTPFLDALLPIINQSGLEINDYITAFTVFADQVSGLTSSSIQDLEQEINELLGLDHSVVSIDANTGFSEAGIAFTYNGTATELGIDLVFQQEAEAEFGYFVDANGLANLIADGPDTDPDPDVPAQIDDERVVIRDPLDAIELVAESIATIDLSLTVDLSNDGLATVMDTTTVDLDIRVDEDELTFQAKVGSSTLFVRDGSIVIDADGDASTDDFLTIATTFEEFALDGSVIEPGVGDEFLISLTGQGSVVIPLFSNASVNSALPSADDPDMDGAPLEFLLNIAEVITDTPGSVTMVDSDDLPDLVPFVSSGLNNLLSDPSLLIDGIDNILSAIQTAIEVPIQGIAQIPLIGDQIGDALQPFFDTLNQARNDLSAFLLDEYAQAISGSDYDGDLTLILQEALYDLFAGSGDLGSQTGLTDGNNDGEGPRLGLLQDLASDGNPNVGFEDILVNQFNTGDDEGIQYDFHLGQSYSISLPFELGLGTNDLGLESFLPGFGFQIGSDEGLTIDLSWDLRIGFGISTEDLFYISTVHFEDISDAGSDYVEELVLALDVSVPGFEADVNLGLVGANITDGTEGPATITSQEKITLFNSGVSPGMITIPSATPIAAGEFNLLLYSDSYDAAGNFIGADTSPTVVSFDVSEKNGLNLADRALALLLDLNTDGFGNLLAVPDLSQIDFLNPNFGITFTALDPDVTRIEFEHVSGNNFGFGEVIRDENGAVVTILDQYEDQRATGLGFAAQQDAVGGVIDAPFNAPTVGSLAQDILFVLTVAGEEVEISVRAASLDDEVDNPNMDSDDSTDDETIGGVEALAAQLQESIDLALLEAGLNDGDVVVSLIPDSDGAGLFFMRLEGAALESIEWNTLETSSVNLKFAVDLFGDVADPSDPTPFDPLYDFIDGVNGVLNPLADDSEQAPNLDRPRLTLPELIGSPQTSIYSTLEGDADLRLHVVTNTDAVDEFVNGLIGISSLGLPSIEFDLKAGIEGTLILFGQVDPDEPADEAFEWEINDIDFDNIQVDLGEILNTVLKPVLGGVSAVLGPVFEIIGDGASSAQGFLNEPIPLITDIASLLGISDDFSWLDLTGNKDSFNAFFDVIEQSSTLITLIDNIGQTGIINLGGWRLVMDDESPFYFPNTKTPVPISVVNAYDNLGQDEVDILQLLGVTSSGSPIPEPGGFTFELLDPANIFKLITGDNFDIFSFNLPKLELELGIDFGFDFDVLEFNIDGGLSVVVDLGIGYDSTGLDRIRQARNEGAPIDGADLLDGFFIRTIQGGGPELELIASFSGSGGVDVHTPSFCIDLGFLGSACFPRFDIFVVDASINAEFSLGFDVRDPNEDGKLRFDEILDITNGFNNAENILFLFDIVGSASGSFDISGTILGASLSASDLGIPLGFSLDFSAQDFLASTLGLPDPFAPIVAERINTADGFTGVIRINAGEFAYARLYGDTNDFTGANVTVTTEGGNIRFTDNASGGASTVLSASGVHSIIFRGVNAGDVLNASGLTQNISVDARGNGGNDTIIGGAGADILLGNAGNDTMSGSGGVDTLFGELGNDQLFGGANTDLLSGGKENDQLSGGTGGDVYLYQTTAGERGGFDRDTIFETEIEAAYTAGRILSIAAVQKEEGGDRILITAENHGLGTGDAVVISGVVGVANANGSVIIDRIDDNSFFIRGREFVGAFDADNGAGYIIDTNAAHLDTSRSPAFNQLTDTIDLRAATSGQSISFVMDSSGTSVSFVEETVAVNTITHNGFGIETLLGGDGNDIYQISANGNGSADHFTNLDGGEGSDQYEIRIGNLNGDVNIQDTGVASAIDTLFVFGRDDAADGDLVGLTNQEILFDLGRASQGSIAYSPVGAGGTPVDSGLEVIQLDLLQGDDVVRIESTPTESTVTVNGGLGSDILNVGVNAATGVETNLNDIDGTEENGTLKYFGNAETPVEPENADDIDQINFYDTTDTTDNNLSNGTNGVLSFIPLTADSGTGKLEGLGITIGVEFSQVETTHVQLGEGDDEFLVTGAVDGNRTTTGLTSIEGGTGADIIDANLSNGGRIEIRGEEDNDIITLINSASADLFFFGDDGDDEINLTSLSAAATITVSGGLANDTVNLGSRRSSSDMGLGTVDNLDGTITLVGDNGVGDDGVDTLILDDSADTAGNNIANGDAGVLNSTSITGLGMASGVGSYAEFEQIYIHTGSGNDEFSVQSSYENAISLIDTNAGNDTIIVSSASSATAGDLDSVEGDLVLHGGDGVNTLLISDVDTSSADSNVVMDESDFDPLRTFIRLGANTPGSGLQNHHFITGLAGQSQGTSPFSTGTIYYSSEFDGATGDFHGEDDSEG
ncbi:MAG: DUF4347 domain-containing protein, partial [Acidiferrobacterales bacterium]|nr:DUF4347 domain-containing protein [Acidiferrobacterales bacterium]